MRANLYCSCNNAIFYLKTLCIGNQHNLDSYILDGLLSQKLHLIPFLSLADFPHMVRADMSMI